MNTLEPVVVRPAVTRDAERVAMLCEQLGYPASQEEVQRRLDEILQNEHHAVYVAELSNGHVIGWVHAYVCQLVITDPRAEIGGLVVDESYRCHGVGRLLMQHAEQWACENGYRTVQLHSNVGRKEAHLFYKSIGCDNLKTSLVFQKVFRDST